MNTPLHIFIGYDPREHAAYEVADRTFKRRATLPVLTTPLVLSHLGYTLQRPVERRGAQLWCPISKAPMSTEFAISRFCIPFIQRDGWALYADCDVLCLGNVAELFTLADPQFAVMVVKHAQESGADTKMDGQAQTYYRRKHWSSVVLWNCAHPAHARLTTKRLNSWPGRELHAFRWLADTDIGELPLEWNYLVGVSPKSRTAPKLLHYTLGGPWLPNWPGGDSDNLWLFESRGLHPCE